MNLTNLIQTQYYRKFPKAAYQLELEAYPGFDLVTLDSEIAGCIAVYQSKGRLDPWRLGILQEAKQSLAIILPHLQSDVKEYYNAWAEIVHQVLRINT